MGFCPRRALRVIATVLACGAPPAAAQAVAAAAPPEIRPADHRLNLNVHLYGFSYHTDRKGVRRSGVDNAFNVGLGLSYTFHENADGIGFVETGLYRDSGSNLAKLAGMGYQYKFGERLRIGGALMAIHSKTYNDGRAFIAPLPIITYDLGAVKLNAIYVPRYGDYNQFAAYGLYFTMPMGQ